VRTTVTLPNEALCRRRRRTDERIATAPAPQSLRVAVLTALHLADKLRSLGTPPRDLEKRALSLSCEESRLTARGGVREQAAQQTEPNQTPPRLPKRICVRDGPRSKSDSPACSR